MLSVADIVAFLESAAPLHRAAEWDNVGLLLGERSAPVQRVLTCLTLTPEVAAEAIQSNTNLVVTHHPILYRPVQSLTDGTPEGRMVLALARAGIAVFSPHSAFDNCAGGINDILAQRFGLSDVASLRPAVGLPQCKLVVFVPDTDLTKVSDAIFSAGAGKIGAYSECSFRVAGTGTFFGSDQTEPTIGLKGRREHVAEWRLEAVVPESLVDRVVVGMRGAHSYEEPAYDLIPLRPSIQPIGDGRVGRLENAISLADFARVVRNTLASNGVQVVGSPETIVQRVAVACGAGGEFLDDVVRDKADVFVTGEMRFHQYLAAQTRGISLILPGHFSTERLGVEVLASRIATQWPGLNVQPSVAETDPVSWF